MSLSSVSIPVKKAGASASASLFDAWQAVRQAREVPWSQDHPEAWRRRFRRAIERAGASIVAHISETESDGELAATELSAGQERRSDHSWLGSQLSRVMEELDSIGPPQIGDVVRLSEWLVMLEMRLVMHHNRFHPVGAQARGRSLQASGTGVMVGS